MSIRKYKINKYKQWSKSKQTKAKWIEGRGRSELINQPKTIVLSKKYNFTWESYPYQLQYLLSHINFTNQNGFRFGGGIVHFDTVFSQTAQIYT